MREITILDPIELPRPWTIYWVMGPIVGLLLLITVILLLRRRRRQRVEAAVVVPSDVWALQQLSTLFSEQLVAKGRVQEFYYRISGIVRGYLERRFSVSAPEMTTEEFLAAAAQDSHFGPSTTGELNRFLTACDLVKYARHIPGTTESDAVFDAAKEFVERTRPRESSSNGAHEEPMGERAA